MKELVNIVEMLNLSTDEIERTGGATLGLCSSREQIKDAVVQALSDIDIYSAQEHDDWNHEFVERERDFTVYSDEDLDTVVDLIADFGIKTNPNSSKTFWFE